METKLKDLRERMMKTSFKDLTFDETLKERIRKETIYKHKKQIVKRKFISGFSVLTYSCLFLVVCLIAINGIKNSSGDSPNSNNGTILDHNTSATIELITPTSDMLLVHYLADNMDRGSHEYFDKSIVVDPDYYKSHDYSRGDVVYFETAPGETFIGRIVGLPGETIEIKEGQILINNNILQSFYGQVHRLGLKKEQYFHEMEKENNDYNRKGMEDLFNYNMSEILVSQEELYIISDDWLRGTQNKVKTNQVIGKVLGYEK